MKYLILATVQGVTMYYAGNGQWQHRRTYGKRYSASDAAMMKIAMSDNPQKFGNPFEAEAVPA